jgi:hypothetical protein
MAGCRKAKNGWNGFKEQITESINIGHPGTQKLYDDYRKYLDGLLPQKP